MSDDQETSTTFGVTVECDAVIDQDPTTAAQNAVIAELRTEWAVLSGQLNRIRNALSKLGYPGSAILSKPDVLVTNALTAKADHDWRDAFMAALTSGASVAHSKSIATMAAHVLARRRGEAAAAVDMLADVREAYDVALASEKPNDVILASLMYRLTEVLNSGEGGR